MSFDNVLTEAMSDYEIDELIERAVNDRLSIKEGVDEYGLRKDVDWYEVMAVVSGDVMDKFQSRLENKAGKAVVRVDKKNWRSIAKTLLSMADVPFNNISIQDMNKRSDHTTFRMFVGTRPSEHDFSEEITKAFNNYAPAIKTFAGSNVAKSAASVEKQEV